jgi:hypothetical protein
LTCGEEAPKSEFRTFAGGLHSALDIVSLDLQGWNDFVSAKTTSFAFLVIQQVRESFT